MAKLTVNWLRELWPVIAVLIFSVIVIVIGIWSPAFVGGCVTPLCNAVRNLEWESLAAGLFGLAGGVAVIAIARVQIKEQRRADVELQLVDLDALIRQYEVDVPRIRVIVAAAIWEVKPDDPKLASAANNRLRLVEAVLPRKLVKEVANQHRLPESVRIISSSIWNAMNTIKGVSFGVTPPHTHYTQVEATRQILRSLVYDMEEGLERLRVERDNYFKLLIDR
ncbi:hypothetical protein [Thalassospira profundimaris]|uniref:hypothetical protein n=1 Tax=Thalassospira profundimaris TaxID=502049 RepID=UPI00028739B3|nr:hypothetical protein [Thalassospira profundimaris]EKF10385.1 hypothetical protein TH2_03425 [Thalassospira profundimaris WP0211]